MRTILVLIFIAILLFIGISFFKKQKDTIVITPPIQEKPIDNTPLKPDPTQVPSVVPSGTLSERIKSYVEKKYPTRTITNEYIFISVPTQMLYLIRNGKIQSSHVISTALKGVGNINGSNQTPLGLHSIKRKIGATVPIYGILKGQQYTGKEAEIITEPRSVNTDDVTSRILWLTGEEKGINLGGNVDSYDRYIFIHGTPEEGLLGTPASHGCIRMRNTEVVELFNKVPVGTSVVIENEF